ncbi:hypothetical protein PV721_17605 [Streptomyces sp. MB09-01]|nr:hypothetical protein [Streptomyces sp. MB09-01]MDX3536157.1 hypothetical protein [Streptomyces sp. MB09-01]
MDINVLEDCARSERADLPRLLTGELIDLGKGADCDLRYGNLTSRDDLID